MLGADSKGPTQVTTGNLCFAKAGVVGWWRAEDPLLQAAELQVQPMPLAMKRKGELSPGFLNVG